MLIIFIISFFAYICIMIAVITGDIIGSENIESSVLMKTMTTFLKNIGSNPKNWEIYRGDQFQLEMNNIEEAFMTAVHFKAVIKQTGKTDLRIAIGIGDKKFDASKVTQSNGSAFVYSGRKFELLKKENTNLAIQSDNEDFDNEMNLFFRFASVFMDEWTVVSAEIINLLLSHPQKNQSEIADILGINQSAVSQRIKRANFELLKDLNNHYIARIKKLTQ